MKKNRLFIATALVLVSIFAFASCTTAPAKSTETKAPTQEESMQEEDKDNMEDEGNANMEESKDKDIAQETMEKEDTMDTSATFTGDAYNFDLMDMSGNTYKLSDLQGKKVYIKFWASWCSICLAGLEEVDELYNEFEDNEDILILTMVPPNAYGEVETDKFKLWFRGLTHDFKVLLDEGGVAMAEYGIRGFPTSVFIDTSGNVHTTRIGHVGNDDIKSVLDEMS